MTLPPDSSPPSPASPPGLNPWLGLLAALAGGALFAKMITPTRPRVFVSYDHEEDLRYRNLLRAWDKNSKFPFTFDLMSPVKRIASGDETVVKRALTPKLKAAEYLFVIVGMRTWRSAFVRWEIERAKEPDVNLKLVAVKVKRSYRTPYPLLGAGTAWANAFTVDAITAALRKAGEE